MKSIINKKKETQITYKINIPLVQQYMLLHPIHYGSVIINLCTVNNRILETKYRISIKVRRYLLHKRVRILQNCDAENFRSMKRFYIL